MLQEFVAELREEFPDIVIRSDRPWWLRAANWLLSFVKIDLYLATQCIGNTIFLTRLWDQIPEWRKVAILRHEREHCRQFRLYSIPLMGYLYLFFPFFIGFAYFRARFEAEGFGETIRAHMEHYGPSEGLREEMKHMWVDYLTGPQYLYPWIFKSQVIEWFNEEWYEALGEYNASKERNSSSGTTASE